MSTERFYVLRHATGLLPDAPERWGWTRIASGGRAQAEKEVAAWVEAGWDASAYPTTPLVRAEVRRWERTRAAGGDYTPDFTQLRVVLA